MKEVTDFRWTRSQRVQSNSVTSLRLQKRSPTLIGIALQVNRAESLHFVFCFLKRASESDSDSLHKVASSSILFSLPSPKAVAISDFSFVE